MIRTRRAQIGGGVLLIALLSIVVFASCNLAGGTPAPSVTPTPTATPTPTPTPSPTPTPVPTPTPTPTPVPLDQALLGRRVTVLVLGLDSDPARAGRLPVNSDAMLVASVNAAHNRISLLSMPRDMVDLPLAGGGLYRNKINSLMRTSGIPALEGALETTYRIKIDYYVTINMSDFGHLVNAVGGVDVDVPYALRDATVKLNLSAGKHHFDGNAALSYVRTRHQDGDFARARRQQQVLMALFAKVTDPTTKVDLKELMGLGSVQTNLPLDKLATLREIGRLSSKAKVSREVFGPPRYVAFQGIDPRHGGQWVITPNLAAIRAYVRSAMGD
jgi:LCP family protein required for cell wall assembly